MKNNLEYYPTPANAHQDARIRLLMIKFGFGGLGRLNILSNNIAQADNCCLDISKKYNKMAVAADLGYTIEELDDFIKYLKNDCEIIIETEPGFITTEIIQEAFKKVKKERSAARNRSASRWGKKKGSFSEEIKSSPEKIKSSPEEIKSSPEPASKVKESKVNIINIADSIESANLNNDFYKTKSGKKITGKRLDGFNQFWDSYNYKQGKSAAADAWAKINPLNNSILKQICQAAKKESDRRQSILERGQTPKWPQGWLSERRWEDEIYQAEKISEEDIKKKYGIGIEV